MDRESTFNLLGLPVHVLQKILRTLNPLEFVEFSLISNHTFQVCKLIKYPAAVKHTYFMTNRVDITITKDGVEEGCVSIGKEGVYRGAQLFLERCSLGGHDCVKWWSDLETICSTWEDKEHGVLFWLYHFRDIFTNFDPLANFYLITEELDREQNKMLVHLANRMYEYGWQDATITCHSHIVNDEDFLYLTYTLQPENSVRWILNPVRGFMNRFRFTSKKVYFEHGHRFKLPTFQLSTTTNFTVCNTAMSTKDMNTLIKWWFEGQKDYEYLRIEIPEVDEDAVVADLPVEKNKDEVYDVYENVRFCVEWILRRSDGKVGWIYVEEDFVVLKVV